MSVLVVVPARHASTRFPGKPLVQLRGASGRARALVLRAWDAACAVPGVDRVVVATDDARIGDVAQAGGAEVVMTSPSARNGSERCAEAHAALGGGFDVVVNLQGDAPLTPPWVVAPLLEGLARDGAADLATPVLPCDGAALAMLRAERAAGRVGGTTAVVAADGGALYFSKEVVPFFSETPAPAAATPVLHHVGVYAWRAAALADYAARPEGRLERLEGLEQLRVLEAGRRILCVAVEARGRPFWEVNNPEDVARVEDMLAALGID